MMRILILLSLLLPGSAIAGEARLISSDQTGVVIEVSALDYVLESAESGQRLSLTGGMIGTLPGEPMVPSVGTLVGIPYGVEVRLEILAAEYGEVSNVELMTTPAFGERGQPLDVEPIVTAGWFPGAPALLGRSGILRDQRVQGVALHPIQYDANAKTLRVARKLRIKVAFSPASTRPALRAPGRDPVFESTYQSSLLNADEALGWRGRMPASRPKQALSWYDANSDWYRTTITEDGVYVLDSAWFETSGIMTTGLDPADLQIYVDGAEIPLLVEDGGDGSLDDGDRVVFYGTFRRASDRDTESRFGRSHTYWLKVGNSGRRYTAQAADPGAATPAPWVMRSVHSEIDSLYERWGEAPDVDRDHWVYAKTASPSTPGGVEFPVSVDVALPDLATDSGVDSEVRVGMHALSLRADLDPDHRTLVEVQDGILIAEDRWDGQIAFETSGVVGSDLLTESTQVTLRTPGSPEYPFEPIPYVDHVHLNWVRITYPSRTIARDGVFTFDASAGEAYEVSGFVDSPTYVLDVENGLLLEGSAIAGGVGFAASSAGRIVVVESSALRVPDAAVRDVPSMLRSDLTGAIYVIVTHPDFVKSAEMLAEHRRSAGLTSMVVDVQDVYDEFNYGDVSDTAIQDFMTYAYDNWSERPVYLLLLGRMSYDYRDLMDQFKNGRTPRVPAMPFQSVRRGQAFTDHFYGTVAGDDPFMDIWVGRFSVNNTREAETVVAKAIAYDESSDDVWRDRVLYMANWDPRGGAELFIDESNKLITDYAEPLGLETYTVYHDETTPPEPNESSSEVIRQINEGRLVINFMGHGSAASMSRYIAGTFQQRGFSYMTQITNAERLPLVIAMSCLNGLYDEPTLVSFAEEMVNKTDGGSIAYVSASSLAFIFVNNEINNSMFRYMMRDGVTEFGKALGMAKTDLIASQPGIDNGVFTMNLMGDPAQRLAIPDGSDYALDEDDIRITSDGDVLSTSDTARVSIRMRNDGIVAGTALSFAVIDRNLDTGISDTIAVSSVPAFGSADSTAVLWPLSGRVGRHQVEVILDPDQLLNETGQNNNRAVVDVEVFGRLSAVQAFPVESQGVSSSASLGVRTGLRIDGLVSGEFELGRTETLDDVSVIRSGRITASNGLAVWTPGALTEGTWYWRARMSDGSEDGAWSGVRSFSVGDGVADRKVAWRQTGAQAFLSSERQGVVQGTDGSVGRTLEPLPLSITADFREETIVAEGVPATAILATDGTFHYVKGFYSLPQVYPDSDTFLKVGSGLGGSTAGENLGAISDPSIPTVSATYHGDGFIYSDNRKSREIVRINPTTGETTVVPVEAGLLEIRSGLVFDGHSLFTSDGSLIYNVANGVNGVPRVGWTVRVFDPAADWSVVREFEVAPTSTGFAFAFTDGVIADGAYLYLIEFGTGSTHRVRVIDALDGTFVEEYQSDQAQTDLLSGQYDWVNNKVWFGQLNGNGIHRYTGRRVPDEGVLTSPPIGPASSWASLAVSLGDAQNGDALVDLLGETTDGTFLPIAEWSDLPAGQVDLSELDTSIDRIKLRVRLSGPELAPSPSLADWAVTYQPVSDIAIANLQVSATEVFELQPVLLTVDVTNRGPIDTALGAVVAFYSGDPDEGRLIGRQAIPENTPIGEPREILYAWITAQWAGTHRVTARVEDLFGQEAFFRSSLESDDVVEIVPSSDGQIPTIEIQSLDATGEIRTGDYVPSDVDFQIVISDSSGVDRSSVEVLLTSLGESLPAAGIGSNLVSGLDERPLQTTFKFSPPAFEDGTHTIEVRANDRVGNGPATKSVTFEVTSDLRLERVLAYPNPMATQTDLTFILSRPSDIEIRIFTLSGRLIRVLNASGFAGYNQVLWDGQDSQGRAIANGTYLYTITADDGTDRVRKKEKLIVYR